MLFDPKIKHNGKIRNIQLVDPSKIVLKDYNSIRNSFKQNDTLLINENDTITSAIAKLDESLHPSREFYIDADAMRKLYPDSVSAINNYGGALLTKLSDGMKIIFNRQLDDIRGYKHNLETKQSMGQFLFNININSDDIGDCWIPTIIDIRQLTMGRNIVFQNLIPSYIGDYDKSDFQYLYLILDTYKAGTNYITIYKTNITKLDVYIGIGRNIY